MSEYIKREDAIRAYAETLKSDKDTKLIAEMILADVPSTDVVEVVRCKDCKHKVEYDDGDGWYCDVTNNCLMRDENFYCSYGERKE